MNLSKVKDIRTKYRINYISNILRGNNKHLNEKCHTISTALFGTIKKMWLTVFIYYLIEKTVSWEKCKSPRKVKSVLKEHLKASGSRTIIKVTITETVWY